MERDEIRVGSGFFRAHGLGNDYLVFESPGGDGEGVALTRAAIRILCHRREGVGSDGIVVLLDRNPPDGIFSLRMFNPDGSEFERSGNGLRVLAAHLRREGLVGEDPFRVRSGGEVIPMTVHGTTPAGVHDISVEMGRARVGEGAVPTNVEHLDDEGGAAHPERGPISFVPVSVGNPHAVVFADDLSGTALGEVGSFLSAHPAFPGGVNVQLARPLGPDRLRIAIWERGVGPTPASGTSSCAAAAAGVRTGRLEPGRIEVEMEGGTLQVEVTEELDLTLRGPVAELFTGRLTGGLARRVERGDG